MKTLPTSDKPTLLVITSKKDAWFSQSLRIVGLDVIGVLDSDISHNQVDLDAKWYKAVWFADILNPPKPQVLIGIGQLQCPTLVVVPAIITTTTTQFGESKTLFDQVISLQSSWFQKASLELSSATFMFVDGLWTQPHRVYASLAVFLPLLSITLPEPTNFPPTLSLVSTNSLLTHLVKTLSRPSLPPSHIGASVGVDTKRVSSQMQSYFQNCFQHTTPTPLVENQTHLTPLPHVQSIVLPTPKNNASEYVQSLGSPSQYVAMLEELHTSNREALLQHQSAKSMALGVAVTPRFNSLELSPTTKGGVSTPLSTSVQPSPPTPSVSPNSTATTITSKQQTEIMGESQSIMPIDSQLQKIFTNKRIGDKTTHLSTAVTTQKKINHRTKRRTRLFWSGSFLTGATLAIVFFVCTYVISSRLLVGQMLQATNHVFAQNDWKMPPLLSSLTAVVGMQTKVYSTLFHDPLLDQADRAVRAHNLLVRYVAASSQILSRREELLSSIFAPSGLQIESVDKLVDLSQLQTSLRQEIQTTLLVVEDSSTSSGLLEAVEREKSNALLATLSPFIPDLLGASGKRTYAVIFQNSQELRPTGGFIQSLALLTFDQGALISSRIYSSYDIDVLLGGRVAAPAEISEFLGEKQLFFRDSNWDADFAITAEKIRWYLNKSLNTPIDGVLAFSTPALGQLLSAVGPVSLPEFNEVVTAQNLSERLENHSEVQGLTPNQPREYSAILLDKIVQALPSLTTTQVGQLIQALVGSLNDANSVFYSPQPTLQQRLVDIGWSGVILNPPCPQPFDQRTCRVEPIYLVEANVGINKANQYISRKAIHKINIDEKAINHSFQITYENQAKTSAWPKGAYKSFVRLYLPPNATFSNAIINGQLIDAKNVKLSVENSRPVVGLLLDVPINSKTELAINFSTPSLNDHSSYIAFHQKQPGTSLPPTTIEVSYPSNITPKTISPQAEVGPGLTRFTPNADPHFMVGLSL